MKSKETLNRIREWITSQPMSHKESKLLTDDDYTYLRILASEVFEKFEDNSNSGVLATQHFERTKANSEELEYQRKAIRQIKGNLAQIQRSIHRTNTTLEAIRNLTSKKTETEIFGGKTLHIFARHSPYPESSIQRFPVSDKFVPWSVTLVDYDPISYTKPKDLFKNCVKEFVDSAFEKTPSDNDLENNDGVKPNLHYNTYHMSGGGVEIDRRSWDPLHPFYLVENNLPVNPYGRTGLKGRGSLMRWGPNHYVMVVITRYSIILLFLKIF